MKKENKEIEELIEYNNRIDKQLRYYKVEYQRLKAKQDKLLDDLIKNIKKNSRFSREGGHFWYCWEDIEEELKKLKGGK